MGETADRVLVVGGGLAGIEATIRIGDAGHEVVLVEREAALGGRLLRLHRSFPKLENPRDLIEARLERLRESPKARVLLSTVVGACVAGDRGFSVSLEKVEGGKESDLEAQAVILATGLDLFDAAVYGEYGYGIYPGVVNSIEFEDQLRQWSLAGDAFREADKQSVPQCTAPGAVAFFKCVGSRDRAKGYPFCSKICCMYSAKQARLVKDLFPEAKCFVFYMDYRAAGKGYEEFVRSVIEDKRVRYIRGRPSKVLPYNGRLLIRAEDTLMGVPIEIEADMVVLATAMVPRSETRELAQKFGAHMDEYGFLESASDDPLRCGERVFFAGSAGFAMGIEETQIQGAAAAAEVVALFHREREGAA